MSGRVLATEEALGAAEGLHNAVRDAIGAAKAILRAGQVLSDQRVWDGPAASEFRVSYWPQALDSLARSLTDMERLEATADRVLQDIMRAGSQGLGGGVKSSQGNLSWRARATDVWAWFADAGVVGRALWEARLEGLLKDAEKVQATLKAAVSADGEQVVRAGVAWIWAETHAGEIATQADKAWGLPHYAEMLRQEAVAAFKRASVLFDGLHHATATLSTDSRTLAEQAARVSRLGNKTSHLKAAGPIVGFVQAGLDFLWFDDKFHDPANAAGYSTAGLLPVFGGMALEVAVAPLAVEGVAAAAPEIAIGAAVAAVAINVQTAYVYTYERRQEVDLGDWRTSRGWRAKGHFLGQAAIDYNNSYVNPPVSPNQSPEEVALENEAHMARFVILTPVGAVAAHETAKHIDDDFGDFGLPIEVGRWL